MPTKRERIAIARVFADLIKADRIIDTGEMNFWNKICEKYDITPEIHCVAKTTPFDKALNILAEATENLRSGFINDCREMTVSDGFCAHSEALILSAITLMLSPDSEAECMVLSVPRARFNIDVASVVFVDSMDDKTVDKAIAVNYRAISKEFQLAGFHFLYLPYIISHYQHTDPGMVMNILRFLAPNLDDNAISGIYWHILHTTTSSFNKDILCNICGIEELRHTFPALLIKIGNSFVADVEYANYIKIEVGTDILADVQKFVDEFTGMLSSDLYVVKSSEECANQFHFFGFYKQLLESFLIPDGVRSDIVINPINGKISFEGLNLQLADVSLGERALYILFLCQGKEGINLSIPHKNKKPDKENPRYRDRIELINRRYQEVYANLGGRTQTNLDLSNRERRAPMISHIQRSLQSLKGLLNPKDYNVREEPRLHFRVHLDQALVWVNEGFPVKKVPLLESNFYRRVMEV